MSASKRIFENIQESQYTLLESLGIARQRIYSLEEILDNFPIEVSNPVETFSEKMAHIAAFAISISGLTHTTTYGADDLWYAWETWLTEYVKSEEKITVGGVAGLWKDFAGSAAEQDLCCLELRKEDHT